MVPNIQQNHPEPSIQLSRGLRELKGTTRLLGGLGIRYLLWFFIPLLVGACLYSYHMAVKLKQEKPFPSATITATACHYPQDIEFRFFMNMSGAFINLIYFTLFRWLKLLKKETGFPYSTEQWLHPWAHLSVLGLYFAVATIDGQGTTSIHGPGAVFFFVSLFIVLGAVTMVLREMKAWCSTVITSLSSSIKTGILLYLVGVAIYCGVGVAHEHEEDHDDPYLVIIEWNLALGGLIWLFFFALDWKNIQVTLKGDFQASIKMISLPH